MSELPLFPTMVVEVIPEANVPLIKYRYFLLAYWPRAGGNWKIHSSVMWEKPDAEGLRVAARDLATHGWHFIRVMGLPAGV